MIFGLYVCVCVCVCVCVLLGDGKFHQFRVEYCAVVHDVLKLQYLWFLAYTCVCVYSLGMVSFISLGWNTVLFRDTKPAPSKLHWATF